MQKLRHKLLSSHPLEQIHCGTATTAKVEIAGAMAITGDGEKKKADFQVTLWNSPEDPDLGEPPLADPLGEVKVCYVSDEGGPYSDKET